MCLSNGAKQKFTEHAMKKQCGAYKSSRLSIIIVNWNGERFLSNLFRSLENQTYKDFEVVFVDNASKDNSIAVVQGLSSHLSLPVKLVAFSRNTGFAGGNIEGLKYCSGEFIALLNPDTEPSINWLEELEKEMSDKADIGICVSKLIAHGTDIIDTTGDGFSTSLKGFKRGEGEDKENHSKQEYVFGACAGAALYRKKMLEDIGFFDEDFFLIHEDTDLNFRAHLYGWKVLYVPTAIVYHKVRSLIGHMSDMAVYYSLRNSEFVRIKNVPLGIFLRCLPEFIMSMILEFVYFAIKHRRFRLYFKAKVDALRMLPVMLKKRTVIMKNKRVSNKYLRSIMTSIWQKDFLRAKVKKLIYD